MLAPICLFTYNRLDVTKLTVEFLQKNFLANESNLIIFSDGPKDKYDQKKVQDVREFLKNTTGFKSIEIIESTNNKGLANSIITGVTNTINQYGKVIVLEDDILTSRNFLMFMNEGLDFYSCHKDIISVCGYNMKVHDIRGKKYPYDMYFAKRSASWGWGTWKEKWEGIDWEIKDFDLIFRNKRMIKEFNQMGSDMYKMLLMQKKGLNNSWAIRYCYHQFKNNLYSVYPIVSKVRNVGFSKEATHTIQKFNRFDVEIDKNNDIKFRFAEDVVLNNEILKKFRAINGIRMRIYSKIRNILNI